MGRAASRVIGCKYFTWPDEKKNKASGGFKKQPEQEAYITALVSKTLDLRLEEKMQSTVLNMNMPLDQAIREKLSANLASKEKNMSQDKSLTQVMRDTFAHLMHESKSNEEKEEVKEPIMQPYDRPEEVVDTKQAISPTPEYSSAFLENRSNTPLNDPLPMLTEWRSMQQYQMHADMDALEKVNSRMSEQDVPQDDENPLGILSGWRNDVQSLVGSHREVA